MRKREPMSDNTTDFSTKCDILSELWLDYREDEEFADFFDYADLGLPLAYAVANKIVENPNKQLIALVEETYNLLCSALEIDENGEYETLGDLFEASEVE